MRVAEVFFCVLMIGLTISLLNQTGLIKTPTQTYASTEYFDSNGNPINNTDSYSYKIRYWADNNQYINQGVQNTNQLYLFSGGDFIRALYLFYDVYVKGMILVQPLLVNLGLAAQLCWFIVMPIYFLYGAAMIEFIGNRKILP